MNPRRLIAGISKTLVLLLLISGIYWYWRVREPQDVIDDARDDLLEQVGTTYVSVHVAPIRQQEISRMITAYGRVEPAPATNDRPAASAIISAPMSARVASVHCVEGQPVTRGQTLFELDHRALDATLAADRAALDQATHRRQQMPDDATTPKWIALQADRDIDLAAATVKRDEAQLATITVVAPIDGIVTMLAVGPGAIADPTKPAVHLIDATHLVLALDVPSDTLGQIKLGDKAIGSFGESTVTRIDAAIDPQTGLGSVDIALPENAALRPGAAAVAQIVVETKPDALVVPQTSVVNDDAGNPTIAMIDDSGRWAVRQKVTPGMRQGDDIEISGDGLKAGQTVVTVGAYGLVDRTRVNQLKD